MFGLRKAVHNLVKTKMQSAVVSNDDIRSEINAYNVIASPGFPEMLDEMVALSTDRRNTAFVLADTPFRLKADATSTKNWATNANNASENGEDGLVSSSPYAAVYYPHGMSTNLDGTNIGGSSFVAHVSHAAAAIHAGLCNVALVLYGSTAASNSMAIGTGGSGGSSVRRRTIWKTVLCWWIARNAC